MTWRRDNLRISAEVRSALGAGTPVVALESTLIAHGMPYPSNVETALRMEQKLRDMGVVPATIAVLGGKPCVGLAESEILHLATTKSVVKLSARDIGPACALGSDGATTVAATMRLARAAGVSVFATGGIGGVHRGSSSTWDVSADLMEFMRSPVLVVSAGAKAILDLPKTLEFLETCGVPVVGFGTQEFPSFYSRKSGLSLDTMFETPASVAHAFLSHKSLSQEGQSVGMLVANPIPSEKEIPLATIETWIEEALSEMKAQGVSGKAVTPFLLEALRVRSNEKTLAANVALFENNVTLAGEISRELTTLERR